MIAKHSHEQSQKGEGVEVIENRPHEVKLNCIIFVIMKEKKGKKSYKM